MLVVVVVLWEEERGPLPLPFDVDVEEVEEVAGARGGGLLRAWRSCVVLRGGFISLVVGGWWLTGELGCGPLVWTVMVGITCTVVRLRLRPRARKRGEGIQTRVLQEREEVFRA